MASDADYADCDPSLRYFEGSALLLHASGETRFKQNAESVKASLEGLNIKVELLPLDQTTVVPSRHLFFEFTEWVRKHDGRGDVLVFGYFGHGKVKDGRLFGSENHHRFDISAMQTHLRDACRAHTLTVLGCCRAGHPLPSPPTPAQLAGHRSVETLAVCNGTSTATSKKWVERLVHQLSRVAQDQTTPKTVAQIGSLVESSKVKEAPGFYRKECGVGSLMLGDIPERLLPVPPLPNHTLGFAKPRRYQGQLVDMGMVWRCSV